MQTILEPVTTRCCSVCKQTKPLSEFKKRPTRPLGRDYRCKECHNTWGVNWRSQRKLKNSTRQVAMEGEKRCSGCKLVRSVTEFHIDRASDDGRRCHCKDCIAGFTKKYNKERPHLYVAFRRRALLTRYGLTVASYDNMLALQGGGCAICGQTSDEHEKTKRPLHIDHDHSTGKVRGLLCSPCNTALGKFKDNIELLQAAIDYLALSATKA